MTYWNRHHRLEEGGGGETWATREKSFIPLLTFGTVQIFLPPQKIVQWIELVNYVGTILKQFQSYRRMVQCFLI